MKRGDFALSGVGEPVHLGTGGTGGGAAPAAPPPLPCLFVTIQTEGVEELAALGELPGPKKKQAEALYQNINWMAETFGLESLGFLTLTVGDIVNGRFVKVKNRKECERRFNNLMRRYLRGHFRCGVVVSERHKDGGLHFHLVVVVHDGTGPVDIRGSFNHELFYELRKSGRRFKAGQVGANAALAAEWKALRDVLPRYGFGRAELTPVRTNVEGIARYMAKYVSKDWTFRQPEDKGARVVRYFGHWSASALGARRMGRRFGAVFGWQTPRAKAWRAMLAQMAVVVECRDKERLTLGILSERCGGAWPMHFSRAVGAIQFVAEDTLPVPVQDAINMHNCRVVFDWRESPDSIRHVTQCSLDRFFRLPQADDDLANEKERVLYSSAWGTVDEKREQLQMLREIPV